MKIKKIDRLDGIDLARFIAFCGMVIVNFKMVMATPEHSSSWIGMIVDSFEGRAAATFVVLAGISFSLLIKHIGWEHGKLVILKRILFLLAVGLLHSLIFQADIIRYYALYFLFGLVFFRASTRILIISALFIPILFVLLLWFFDYDKGWDWVTLTYIDFWTFKGFSRNLFFNSWHPVIPWLAFFLFGMTLSRQRLHQFSTQLLITITGFFTALMPSLILVVLSNVSIRGLDEFAILFATKPLPPMPLYIISGIGTASVIIGISLLAASWLNKIGKNQLLSLFTCPGRQALTLYLAHVILGMTILELLGMLGSPQPLPHALIAALIFCCFAVLFATIWSRYFSYGPVEMLMRRLTSLQSGLGPGKG